MGNKFSKKKKELDLEELYPQFTKRPARRGTLVQEENNGDKIHIDLTPAAKNSGNEGNSTGESLTEKSAPSNHKTKPASILKQSSSSFSPTAENALPTIQDSDIESSIASSTYAKRAKEAREIDQMVERRKRELEQTTALSEQLKAERLPSSAAEGSGTAVKSTV